MGFMEDVLERVVDVIGRVGRTVLVPWGGAEACVDAYETAVRAVTDAQLGAARADRRRARAVGAGIVRAPDPGHRRHAPVGARAGSLTS